MEEIMIWIAPIIVAIVSGLFSYFGVARTAKSAHDASMAEYEKQILMITQQINSIQDNIKRLEIKQDKHNAIIERTFKLEQQVNDLEKRIN